MKICKPLVSNSLDGGLTDSCTSGDCSEKNKLGRTWNECVNIRNGTVVAHMEISEFVDNRLKKNTSAEYIFTGWILLLYRRSRKIESRTGYVSSWK